MPVTGIEIWLFEWQESFIYIETLCSYRSLFEDLGALEALHNVDGTASTACQKNTPSTPSPCNALK